ncbi:acyl-CoA thioesterase [Bacillus sp. AK128]
MKNISYIEDFQSWKSEFTLSWPIKVRFTETDMFGHVNNTTVFTYFEEARLEFFKELGLMQFWLTEESDYIPVVADLQCDYLAQTYFDEKLNVYVKIHKIGRSSVELHYLVEKENGTPAFTGRGAIVQISKQTGKSEPWADTWKQMLLEQQNKAVMSY